MSEREIDTSTTDRQEQIGGGWWWPGASNKAHFFRPDARSLCGKWAALGHDPATFPLAAGPGPDDCRACWRKLGVTSFVY